MPPSPFGRFRRATKPADTERADTPAEPVETRSITDSISGSGIRYRRGGLSDNHLDTITTGEENYRLNPIVMQGLGVVTEMMAMRRLVIRDGDGEVTQETHPLLGLWNITPNASQSAHAFRSAYIGRLMRYGQAHIIMHGLSKPGDTPSSLTVVTGQIDRVMNDPTLEDPYGSIRAWVVRTSRGGRFTYQPHEVLWLRFPDPDDPWGCISPLAAALTDVGLAHAAKQWQASEFHGGSARAALVLEGVGDDAADAFHDELDAVASGSENAGRYAVLNAAVGGRMHHIPLNLSAKEMSFTESLTATDRAILHALGIPIDVILGQSTYENQQTATRNLWSQNLLPRLALVASEIDRVLLPDEALTVDFDISDVPELQADEIARAERERAEADSKARRLQMAAYADMMTVDELRAAQGLDPIEGGDVPRSVYIAREQERLLRERYALYGTGERAATDPARTSAETAGFAGSEPPVRRLNDNCETHSAQLYTQPGSTPATRADNDVQQISDTKQARTHIDRYTRTGERAVRRLARQQGERVVNLLKRQAKRSTEYRIDPEDPLRGIWNAAEQREMAAAAVTPASEAAFMEALTGTALALEKLTDLNLGTGKISEATEKAITARALETAELINETTAEALADALREGALAGEGAKDLAQRVLGVFGDMAEGRAETIARDVVLGAFHEGQRLAVVESGLEGVRRRWNAATDNRVRPSHAALHGYTTQGMDDRYPNGALYPGDRAAGPAESIQCRCVEEFLVGAPEEDD